MTDDTGKNRAPATKDEDGRRLKGWHKAILTLAALALLYTAFGFLAVPIIVKKVLEGPVARQLYRSVSLDKAKFNPFNLECELHGMKVFKQGHEKPLLDLDYVLIDLEASSIWKRALIVQQFVLQGPDIWVMRYKDGSFSFSDALEKMQQVEAKRIEETNEPFHFSINNIRIEDGTFHFVDELEGSDHLVEDMTLAIPFISNLKTKVNIFTTPKFSAVIDGTRFETDARTQPFSPTRPGEARIRFTDLELEKYFPYADQFVNGDLEGGRLSADFSVDFRLSDKGEPIINLNGTFGLKELTVLDEQGRKAVALDGLEIVLAESDVVDARFDIERITLSSPYLLLELEEDGGINLTRLVAAGKEQDEGADLEPSPPAEGPGARIRIEKFSIENGHVNFTDLAYGKGFSTSLKGLNLTVTGVDTQGEKPANWHLACSLLEEADLEAAGQVSIQSGSAVGVVELDDLSIPALSPYYGQYLDGRLASGSLSVDSLLFEVPSTGAEDQEIVLKDIAVTLEDLEIRDTEDRKVISVEETGLEGASVDLKSRSLHTGTVFLRGAETLVEIGQDGSVNLARLAAAPVEETAPGSQAGEEQRDMEEEASEEQGPWTVEIERVELSRIGITALHHLPHDTARIRITGLEAKAKGLSTRPGVLGDMELSALLNGKGKVSMKGKTCLDPLRLDATIEAGSIPLASFQSYLPPHIRLTIARGAAWAKSRVTLDPGTSGPVVKVSADLDVKGFKALEKDRGKEFASWKGLSVRAVSFTSDPLKIEVAKVLLDQPYAMLELDEKGMLNVNRIFPPSPSGQEEASSRGKEHGSIQTKGKETAETKGTQSSSKENTDLLLDQIEIRGGRIEVVDRTVEPFFRTELTDFNCKIEGLGSLSSKPASIVAEGRLPGNAVLRIEGAFNPFGEQIFADLDLSLRNLGLTRFTPYTGKYLGYTLQKGKASVELDLKLQERRVDLLDKIEVDQLDFGQSVDSEDATGLPVKLAVALLKDRSGRIRLNIPVSGSLDDPDFSIAGAVWQVITNLITKAATSPFSLLASAFGASEEIRVIPFEPGSIDFTKEALQRLDLLAKIMAERPELQVELLGSASEDRDLKALHEKAFWRLIKAQKFQELSAQERERTTVDQVEISQQEYADYLEKAYEAADFKRPRNFLGMLKSQPPEVMERMLKEHLVVGQEDLRDLANRRARRVQDYLVGEAGIDAGRIFVLEFGSRPLEIPEGEPKEVVEVFIR